jgi:type IV pilus assembly protein PilC
LEETLDDMAAYYTEIDKTRKQMISAIMYPSIVSVFALGVIVFILVYVVPQFTDIYKQSGVSISGLTKFIVGASTFLKHNWYYILLFIVAFAIIFSIAYKKIKAFRVGVQKTLMKTPIIKNLIIYNEMTIFTKTFASLLKNNVFITDSMDILVKITNNEIYKDIIYQTIDNISKGENISESFKNHWAIPEVAYHMIVTGESTGELAQMMQKVSEYYQEQHRNLVTNLKNFIEPIMIVTLAVVVGGIILAVMVPMFGLYDTIK